MNLKKILILMLVGIVCSVSVVSAADINDTAVEIQSNDATINVDELQNDITIQKSEENATDETPVQSDENALGQNNTTSNDVKNNSSVLDTDFDFNLDSNTPTIELFSFSDLINGVKTGFNIIHNKIANEIIQKYNIAKTGFNYIYNKIASEIIQKYNIAKTGFNYIINNIKVVYELYEPQYHSKFKDAPKEDPYIPKHKEEPDPYY